MKRCVDCGYLALRRLVDGDIVEADTNFRESGLAMLGPERQWRCSLEPLCFMRQSQLGAQTRGVKFGTKEVVEAIGNEHDCAAFVEWSQGFSPKEHAEAELEAQRIANEHEWRERALSTQTRTTIVAAVVGFLGGLAGAALTYLLGG